MWISMLWISRYQVLSSVFFCTKQSIVLRMKDYLILKYKVHLFSATVEQFIPKPFSPVKKLWVKVKIHWMGLFVSLTSYYFEHVTYDQRICFRFYSKRGWICWSLEKSSFRKGRKTFLTQWHRLKLKISGRKSYFGLEIKWRNPRKAPRADVQH